MRMQDIFLVSLIAHRDLAAVKYCQQHDSLDAHGKGFPTCPIMRYWQVTGISIPLTPGLGFQHATLWLPRCGAFNDVAGHVFVNPEDPADARVEVRVQLASIDTRNQQRDEHLRSADYFDTEHYPEMIFIADTIDEVEEHNYVIVGELTLRGITRPLTLPLAMTGLDRDPSGALRAGLEGTRRITRKDWGMAWNTPLESGGVLVSDKITLEFELSLVKREQHA